MLLIFVTIKTVIEEIKTMLTQKNDRIIVVILKRTKIEKIKLLINKTFCQ